jgi:hypothetical protein
MRLPCLSVGDLLQSGQGVALPVMPESKHDAVKEKMIVRSRQGYYAQAEK